MPMSRRRHASLGITTMKMAYGMIQPPALNVPLETCTVIAYVMRKYVRLGVGLEGIIPVTVIFIVRCIYSG